MVLVGMLCLGGSLPLHAPQSRWRSCGVDPLLFVLVSAQAWNCSCRQERELLSSGADLPIVLCALPVQWWGFLTHLWNASALSSFLTSADQITAFPTSDAHIEPLTLGLYVKLGP